MSFVTLTLQKRFMMGALKTTQFTVGIGPHALCTRPPASHKQQVCVARGLIRSNRSNRVKAEM